MLLLVWPEGIANPATVAPQLPQYEPVVPPVMGLLRLVGNVATTHLVQAQAETLRNPAPRIAGAGAELRDDHDAALEVSHESTRLHTLLVTHHVVHVTGGFVHQPCCWQRAKVPGFE